MRRPRSIEEELAALARRVALLKARRVTQIGELVVAIGADSLDPDTFAGALLDAVSQSDASVRRDWKQAGEQFFRGERQPHPRPALRRQRRPTAAGDSETSPAGGLGET